MVSDRSTKPEVTLQRILAERLEQYEIPSPVVAALREEILNFFQRPEKKLSGATVMTAAASMAADKALQSKKPSEGHEAKPQNL
jgi:hypothetical protein